MNQLVNGGMSFREAYKKVGNDIEQNNFDYQPGQLKYTKVKSVVLLTNNVEKAEDLRRASIIVSDTKQITVSVAN